MAELPERLSVLHADISDPTDLMRHLERTLNGTGPPIAPVPTSRAAPSIAPSVDTSSPDTSTAPPGSAGGLLGELPAGLRRALAPDEPVVPPHAGTTGNAQGDHENIAVVLPTSGSTGEPKGVLLSARALRASALATLERLGGPGQWLLALPPTRVAGLQVLVRSVLGGTAAPLTLEQPDRQPAVAAGSGHQPDRPGGFDPAAFVTATRRLVSAGADRRYTALVPTQLKHLLDADDAAIDAMRAYDAVLVGGAAASGTLLARARDAGVAVVTTYGSTETSGGCVYDGAPLDGVRVSLDPDGRILIGGDVLFSGYRLDPAATANALIDGWYRTADLGRIDEQGQLAVLGRTDDVVISGGVNVPLPAVEDAVSALPAVAGCAVVGVDDPVWGTKVVAFVVPRSGAEAPTLTELRDAVSTRYPREYAPRKIVVLSELPMLESGKVDRLALRSRIG